MLLDICDIITTICQSCLLVWSCNNIASKDNKLSRTKSYILMSIIFMTVIIFTYSGINVPMSNLLMVLIFLLFIVWFYRKSIIDAFLGFGLVYSVIIISSYFLLIFYQSVLIKLNLQIPTDLQMIFFIYIPVWLTYLLVYKNKKYIFETVIFLKSLRSSLNFILIIDYVFIFLDTLRAQWTSEGMSLLFKATLYLVTAMILVISSIYFAKINDNSKEVEALNSALNEKITELRKIKHDYGSEISGLYGLYKLGKIDRLGGLLKSIVERDQAFNSELNVNFQATPMVASVLSSAAVAGIDVITFDSGDYENLTISDNDLLKLLSNIIKNSVDVLKDIENPMIKFKSYNSYNGIIITISNNGPEISKHIKNKIFESGFSTKENINGDRGYGLSIVRDIIKRYNGNISIESDKQWTQFKIEIPYKVS